LPPHRAPPIVDAGKWDPGPAVVAGGFDGVEGKEKEGAGGVGDGTCVFLVMAKGVF